MLQSMITCGQAPCECQGIIEYEMDTYVMSSSTARAEGLFSQRDLPFSLSVTLIYFLLAYSHMKTPIISYQSQTNTTPSTHT